MAESLDEEMVASYSVSILGIDRTRAELAKLDGAIRSLRAAEYSPGATVTGARFGNDRSDRMLGGRKDIFATVMDDLEGRVQTGATEAMAKGMALGRRAQEAALRAATTKTGLSGASHVGGRNGPGRDDSGDMIKQIATNVEVRKVASVTAITGWHGWRRGRSAKISAQERGTKGRKSGQAPGSLNRKVYKRKPGAAKGLGVPAANSLGTAIIIVREDLKRSLGGLKK